MKIGQIFLSFRNYPLSRAVDNSTLMMLIEQINADFFTTKNTENIREGTAATVRTAHKYKYIAQL